MPKSPTKHIESQESEEVVETKAPRVRKPAPTSDSVSEELLAIIDALDAEIKRTKETTEKVKGVRFLSKVKRQLVDVNKQLPRIRNGKAKKRVVKGNSGIKKPKSISDELADFLQVERGTLLSMADVTSAVCTYIRIKDDETNPEKLESRKRWEHLNPNGERNLQDQTSKKNIVPDEALSDLLRYEQYRKDVANGKIHVKSTGAVVTDDRLNYCVLQKLIAPHFVQQQ
ncbi:SWIB/MDM2 domain-containing protein [Cannes 8 virus]|uniref:SWIB/MDM2 domain-containing protein n=1 Tax=Marseillevirus marseillevirus TaxID=694581 RepID=D2XAT7_GBMV|nr:SWIB/MDM2 domain-containing protein [Marseillevirus marseillevirus]YP_009094762.1 conserved SWIB/MDM2 domain-containing protein [Melbournevirus]AGV01653.1 SWIB/MDM2 domain-containing protein [Cannes 8 virus]AVR53007.1 SWIB/MDM2 domain-containing protein [Marseillevirus Shanghai 1]ADB04064.1 SWIB/MDM2 domain-containing protein [Marseillevirus marseillevirus]AIT54874.1 SWIB-domain-containing protein [Melbournevirus]